MSRRRTPEEQEIDAIAARDRDPPRRGARRISLDEAVSDLRRLSTLPIYDTPFPSLNTAVGLGGHIAGQVFVLAGGTGVGKTTMLLEFAGDFALRHGPVLFVSLEMPVGYCVARAAAPKLGVSSNALIRGEVEILPDALGISRRIEWVERATLGELRATVEEMIVEHKQPPLVIVDYMEKLRDMVMATMDRPDPRLATTAASSTLLSIARDLSAPLVVASGVSRAKMRGVNGKPFDPRRLHPGELVDSSKESSAVEYDCAAMLTLHVAKERDVDNYQVATLTVAKARFGSVQHIAMAYDGAGGRWLDRGRVEMKTETIVPGAAVEKLGAELAGLRKEVLGFLEHGPMSRTAMATAIRKAGGSVHLEDISKAVAQLVRAGHVESIGGGRTSKVQLAGPPLPGLERGGDAA